MNEDVMVKIKEYSFAYEQLKRKKEIIENNVIEGRKAGRYMDRSKDDLLFATVVKKLIEKTKIRLELGLPEDYPNLYHWLIISSYYAMCSEMQSISGMPKICKANFLAYHAATAAISKKKIKSESHIATITALAKHYLTAEELELDFIKTLEYVYITYIESGRESRRGAQYNVDKEYKKEEAYEVFENAGKFVKRIGELLE